MKGFTLIELLISVAILGIVAGVGGDLLLTSIRSYNKSQVLNTLSQNGGFALTTLKNEVQNAQSATCTVSSLNVVNQAGNLIIYSITAGTVSPCTNGSFMRGSDYLLNTATSPTVGVTGGSFTCDGNLVTINLGLSQACGTSGFDSGASTSLRTSVLVRGAYR